MADLARSRRIIGAALLIIGTLLFANRTADMGTAVDFMRDWWPIGPMAFLVVGLASFLRSPRIDQAPVRWSVTVSGVLLLGAIAALLLTTGVLPISWNMHLLPALTASVGLLLVAWEDGWRRQHQPAVAVTAVLCRVVLPVKAKGVYYIRARAFFGDVHLDLSQSMLRGQAEVHATVWRGRLCIRCGADWDVDRKEPIGPNLLIRDERKPSPSQSLQAERRQRLVVHAMGGHGLVVLI